LDCCDHRRHADFTADSPIMGLGYGLGIYDASLIRRSLKNLGIATLISLCTSTLYFFLSPLTGAHSELLPRTTPNIWDVLIALFGGLAGMGGRYITESRLHQKMLAFVRPGTSFHDLDEFANEQIREEGFENLDFLGNVGRSICQHRDDRLYIEAGNHRRLGEVGCFTFEPHISQHGSCWGLKHENIYYFDDSGVVTEL
jgi:hypothetical protein